MKYKIIDNFLNNDDFNQLCSLKLEKISSEKIRVYNNRTSSEILSMPIEFITKIGLNDHLSVTRKNGLSSMVSAIKKAAKA